MGISDLNFGFGFMSLFVLFGIPFLVWCIFLKFIEWSIDKCETLKFDTDTPGGFFQYTEYLSEKYQKRSEREKNKPKLTKFLRCLLAIPLFGGYFLVVFVWGFVLIQIMK